MSFEFDLAEPASPFGDLMRESLDAAGIAADLGEPDLSE